MILVIIYKISGARKEAAAAAEPTSEEVAKREDVSSEDEVGSTLGYVAHYEPSVSDESTVPFFQGPSSSSVSAEAAPEAAAEEERSEESSNEEPTHLRPYAGRNQKTYENYMAHIEYINGPNFSLKVAENWSFSTFKIQIYTKTRIGTGRQRLMLGDQLLSGGNTHVRKLGITAGVVVTLSVLEHATPPQPERPRMSIQQSEAAIHQSPPAEEAPSSEAARYDEADEYEAQYHRDRVFEMQ